MPADSFRSFCTARSTSPRGLSSAARMCTVAEWSPDVSVQKWRSCSSTTPGHGEQALAHLAEIHLERRSLEEDVRRVSQHAQRSR